jgi:putative ABC transport system permease protein
MIRLFATWRSSKLALAILVVTVVLGAGIGGGFGAGIYGIFHGVRPGIATPESLVWIGIYDRSAPGWLGDASLAEVIALSEHRDSFAKVAAYSLTTTEIRWRATTLLADGNVVVGDYFGVLGTIPLHGRTFGDSVAAQDESQIVLSDAIWARFGRPTDFVGSIVFVNGEPLTVVGITVPGFHGPDLSADADFWVPLGPGRRIDRSLPRAGEPIRFRRFRVVARQQIGQSLGDATAAATVVIHRAEQESAHPGDRFTAVAFSAARGVHPTHIAYLDHLLLGPAIGTLFLLVVVLLNAAGILTSRTLARRGELALRMVLGATRKILLIQLLREIAVVILLAAVPATILTVLLVRLLPTVLSLSFHGASIEPPFVVSAGAVLVLVTLLAVAACAGAASLVSRYHLETVLREEGTTVGIRQRGYVLQLVVVTLQAATSTALLVGIIAVFLSIREADSRAYRISDLEHLAVAQVHFAAIGNTSMDAGARLATLMRRVTAISGVTEGAAVTGLPLRPEQARISLARWPIVSGGKSGFFTLAYVDPGFFHVMQRPVLMGRELTEADRTGAPNVALLNQSAAKRLGVNQQTLGSDLTAGDSTGAWRLTVVGIVPDLGVPESAIESQPTIYVPFGQLSEIPGDISVVLRSTQLAVVLSALRGIGIDGSAGPGVSLNALSLTALMQRENAGARFALMVMVPLVLTALLMAFIGVYGVVSGVVQRRSREMGIRMALGSSRIAAMGLVGRDAMFAVASGLLLGVATIYFMVSFMEGASPWRPSALALAGAGVVVALGAVAAMSIATSRFWSSEPVTLLRIG